MSDALYKIIRLLGSPFSYRCLGLENVRHSGPAIYVANHVGSIGPVEIILSLPARLYPWAIAEMTDIRRAPSYLYDDFVHPVWRLSGRLGMAVSAVVSRLAVGLINGLECIPVDRKQERYMEPFRRSLPLLDEGKSLLIFPEDPEGPIDPVTLMRPFMGGFVLLCFLYQRLTNRLLPVYPVAVSSRHRTISVGRSLFLESQGNRRHDIHRACARVQEEVSKLYKALQRVRPR